MSTWLFRKQNEKEHFLIRFMKPVVSWFWDQWQCQKCKTKKGIYAKTKWDLFQEYKAGSLLQINLLSQLLKNKNHVMVLI